jgi:hypothetical protein
VGYIMNRLFSVGLSLESAGSIVGNGPAGDRIAAAADEVDRMIRDIRTALFGLVENRPALVNERMAHGACDAGKRAECRCAAGATGRPSQAAHAAGLSS